MSRSCGNVLVIGLGNPDRGDDGVGPLVAKMVSGAVRSIVRTGDALALIEDWAGTDAVLLVDAAGLVSRPGRIHRIDAVSGPLPRDLSLSSTHAFGLGDAVDLARVLGVLPPHLIVFAVEGACFEPGAAMTPEVASAAGKVALLVTEELHILNGTRDPAHA